MKINLETGSSDIVTTPPDLSDDACRTTELWLRWIPAGTFTMGSPEDELWRYSDERQHQVTLTSGYFIGLFEVTQKQWKLVMGGNPSYYKGDTRPVENVSYKDIRGSSLGAGWPSGGHAVDADSFLGKLRAKTGGLLFDLPTEAQWEYACRAGTTTALNSGKNLTDKFECPNMSEVGRYYLNRGDGKGGYSEHTKVGSYLANAWGVYDMHGNVYEWCLDWRGDYPTEQVSDPSGATSGSRRMLRGGYWNHNYGYPERCRSACRFSRDPSYRYDTDRPLDSRVDFGFRVVCCAPGQ
jgi:formylglycine-generating enzyme required for sulfatase activity